MSEDQALSAEELIAELRGADPRPLLITRPVDEVKSKQVNDLFKAAIASERFKLASQWFHCIKLDEKDIENSKYRNLFPGRNPAHIVVSTTDGTKRVEMLGTTGQKVTWKKLTSVLKKSYKKSPDSAIKRLEKLLNTFDALDQRETELNAQLARNQDKNKKSSVKKIEKQLEKLAKERQDALDAEAKARELELRREELATSDE